jgi:hypothetical protein
MNPFDALLAKKTPQELSAWLEPVKRKGTGHVAKEMKPRRPARLTQQNDPTRALPVPFGFQHSSIAGALVVGPGGQIESIRAVMVTDFYRDPA